MNMSDPMSGWMFTTEAWTGEVESLTYHHLYHVTARRPDIARYLALPFGFCFRLNPKEEIWFEEVYAEEVQ